jgi:hypothetical protein
MESFQHHSTLHSLHNQDRRVKYLKFTRRCLSGYCSFAFSKNSSISGASSIFVIFREGRSNILNLRFNSHNTSDLSGSEKIHTSYIFVKTGVDNLHQFTSNISSKFIGEELNFVIFASNIHQKPSKDVYGNWIFPKHNSVSVKDLKGFLIFVELSRRTNLHCG